MPSRRRSVAGGRAGAGRVRVFLVSVAPQARRLLRLIERLQTPVVQVWGPPGSGRGALLAALLEQEGAVGLAPVDLGSAGEGVRRAVEAGARWLVCHSLPRGQEPEEMIRELAEQLPAGRRLVVSLAGPVEVPELLCGRVPPGELALTPDEAAELWEAVAGRRLGRAEAERIVESTEGWYRTLLLAAEAAARHREVAGTGERPVGGGPSSGSEESADAPAPEVRYRVRLLGRPEVHRAGAGGQWEQVSFSLKRGFRVLAYLASAPEHRAAREELIEAVWPEAGRETIERNFHPTLSRLRRDLRGGARAEEERGDPLAHHEGFYELAPEMGWWIDVEEVERLAALARNRAEAGLDAEAAELFEASWRLHRGALLETTYDPWAERRRETVQRRHLAMLRELGSAYERLGRLEDATDAYRALLADDPLQERIHVALMRLYAGSGRRDLVRRQYERLTRLLRNELGVEPLPETADEYHRLMIEWG